MNDWTAWEHPDWKNYTARYTDIDKVVLTCLIQLAFILLWLEKLND